MYINGVRETSFSSENYPTNTTTDGSLNAAYSHYIGGRTNNTTMFDGYLAEVNFLDGVAVTDTSGVLDELVEIKNGVCIPKAYSGSYGTTGFRLTFADSSSLGDDTSDNTNDFATGGSLASTDVVPDSPTNNFPTLNVLDKKSGITLSEGSLKRVDSADAWESITAPFGMTSGKYYAEFVVTVNGSGSFNNFMVGVVKSGFNGNISDSRFWASFSGEAYHAQDGNKIINGSGSSVSYGATWTVDDIIGVALNLDDGEITYYKNNVSQGVANTGLSGEYVFVCATYHSGTHMRVNFGADNTFAGEISSSGNTDANGSVFKYTPPSGFVGLNSTSIPDTTLSPNQSEQATDYFNTITYTGDNATSRSLTGVGFQPDWIWYKDRTNAYGYVTYDSSRGTGEKHLRIDGGVGSGTLAEGGYNDLYGTLTSFDSDGITIAKGDDTSAPSAFFNTNSASMVGWNWKCNGGTTSSNTDGDITSTVQVNTKAGFSIVTFTGNGTNGSTVGHGLGVKPAWYMVKDRDTNSAGHWMVWHHKFADVDNNLFLNLSNGLNNGGFGTGDPATTTTFEPSVTTYNNVSSNRYVAYVFAEVEGYSKMGTYSGNSNADGTFVYTGFRPAWVLFKATHVDDWVLADNKRDPHNQVNGQLFPSNGIAESTANAICDFTSNGFKLRRNAGSINQNTYIYMAFAEQPFKFSNAR